MLLILFNYISYLFRHLDLVEEHPTFLLEGTFSPVTFRESVKN